MTEGHSLHSTITQVGVIAVESLGETLERIVAR
jgi:hypothetical protein